MKLHCPSCRQAIAAEHVNVGSDVAFCVGCNEGYALSSLIAAGESDEGELGEPPSGCWFTIGFDDWQVGATTRSYAALVTIPFTCVWSGFSLIGIYGKQIAEGKFDLGQSLFGIPFVIGTFFLVALSALTVCGKTTLTVRDDQAESFVGIGPIGWRRRFEWSGITGVTEGNIPHENPGKQGGCICLESNGTRIRIASGVTEERRNFMIRALRKMLVKTKR